MATEICERVRGSETAELRDRAQSAGGLCADAKAKGVGRPAFDENTRLHQQATWASDQLLELLKLHHPSHAPTWVGRAPDTTKTASEAVSSAQRDESAPVPENPAPSQNSDGYLRLLAEPEACGVPEPIETDPDLPEPTMQRYPKIEEIQRATAHHYNVSRHDILSSRRDQMVVRPRQVAMYIAKIMTLRSLPEIGRRFGGRDHTTCLHAIRKIAHLIQSDQQLAADVEAVRIATVRAVARAPVPA